MMKRNLLTLVLLLVAYVLKAAVIQCPVIPVPTSYSTNDGHLKLTALQHIIANDPELESVAHFLQKEILKHTGLPVTQATETRKQVGSVIILNKKNNIPAEGYQLSITPTTVKISASSATGAFNGVISFLQLVRLASDNSILCWQIEDAPEMKWRGLMLDESRHFFGKKAVREILDWMAFYKMNRFHWHLTDRQGWRLEVKKYPKLHLVGGIGDETDSLKAAAFYTQADINEIVQYAAERHIEVIPEIDMPGHATAANRAYPEFSGGGSLKRPDFTFNPGKEETYSYLTNILKEVKVLFPARMIHIGGDEVHFGNEKWPADKDVMRLMEREKLKDVKEVESYFIKRMADSVIKLDSKVLGWDEIAGTKIPGRNTIIFWWRHDKTQSLQSALNNGYQTVLCPRIPLYFDFIQDNTHISGRKWGQNISSLETLYNFSLDRYSDILTDKNRDLILGIQACVWSEKISSVDRLQYMVFPRIAALAESAWAKPQNKDLSKFKARLSQHQIVYQKSGLKYYDALKPHLTPEIIDIQPEVIEDNPEAK